MAHSSPTSAGRATSSMWARPPWAARHRQFLRPFLAYGVIILWAARIARRRPGARLQPLEMGLIVVAIGASATYSYNRAAVVVPLLALVTAYSCFGRRQSPARIVALLVIARCPRFHIRGIPGLLFGHSRRGDQPGTSGIGPAGHLIRRQFAGLWKRPAVLGGRRSGGGPDRIAARRVHRRFRTVSRACDSESPSGRTAGLPRTTN